MLRILADPAFIDQRTDSSRPIDTIDEWIIVTDLVESIRAAVVELGLADERPDSPAV